MKLYSFCHVRGNWTEPVDLIKAKDYLKSEEGSKLPLVGIWISDIIVNSDETNKYVEENLK